MDTKWTSMHTVGMIGVAAAILVVGFVLPAQSAVWIWLLTMALLAAFIFLVGHGITGLWRGWLIDDRNKMSLSRLQLSLWTIVVLSGILVAASVNLRKGNPDPLGIAIPAEIWIALGISTTSMVGSPLIRTNKYNQQRYRYSEQDLEARGVRGNDIAVRGNVVVNRELEYSQWADLFKGEEVGNFGVLDIGKVQMFYFTAILVLVYAVSLGNVLAHPAATTGYITSFPPMPPSMVALLGISHAGYLADKIVPHV